MSMSSYNLLGLRYHGRFYTVVISQFHQQLVSKGSVDPKIPIIGKAITIWDEVFFKLRVSFDETSSRKKVFLESSHRIDNNLDVVVEVPEVYISAAF